MKAFIALFVLLVLVSPAVCDIWTSCGTATDVFKIGTVTITPDPPVKGQTLSVVVSGVLSEPVNTSSITISIKDGIIPLISETKLLCDVEPVNCTAPAGAWKDSISIALPSSLPSGSFTGKVTLVNVDKKEVACINIALKL